MSQKFAAFDIDGTVVRTALFLQIVDELIAQNLLDPALRSHFDDKLDDYKARRRHDAFHDYNETVFQTFISNLAGLNVAAYRAAVDHVVDRSREQVYVFTRDLIQKLKTEGYFLIAISGSEQYTVEQFTQQFGFDVVVGDRYSSDDGIFTGHYDSDFDDKGTALRRIIAKHDLTLDGSIAVGDSASDAKMLEVVERPIAFNPEAHLLNIAQDMRWEVVIERKNVIYQLSASEDHDGQYVLA